MSAQEKSKTIQHEKQEHVITLKPGNAQRIENTATEKIETDRPQFTRIEKALMHLGHVFPPKDHYYEKRRQTTYLLVSQDILQTLKDEVPQFFADLQLYNSELEAVKASRTVSEKDIKIALRKRQPTIALELEQKQHREINQLNDQLLKEPSRPALLGQGDNPPQVIVLEGTNGVGIKLTLEETRHLVSESKQETGIAVSAMSKSVPLTFNGENMNPAYDYTRGIKINGRLTIGAAGVSLTLTGKGPNNLDLLLRNGH